MAVVVPFKGVRYNREKIDDMSKVTAPPYDVISPEQQEKYYENSPYNVIRLILGKQFSDDSASDNRYTRAASFFNRWQEDSILQRDRDPSFYFYRQEFVVEDGQRLQRDGFIGLVRLEDPGSRTIIPHERTLDKPKEDRLRLMMACHAHFCAIFSLYSDPEDVVCRRLSSGVHHDPLIEVTDEEGTTHQLWQVTDTLLIQEVSRYLKEKSLYIADGHHRYETALTYCNMQLRNCAGNTGREPFRYVMMYLTSMEGKGLVILPYHRVIRNLKGFDFNSFIARLGDYFEIRTFFFNAGEESQVRAAFTQSLRKRTTHPGFGMYGAGERGYYLLTLKEPVWAALKDDSEGSSLLKGLDVNVLESFVFRKILGMTSRSLEREQNVTYVHDVNTALELVRTGGYQLAFLLQPPMTSQIRQIADRGETMPQKSTYFHPKVLSGLVINKMVSGEVIEHI